MSKVLLVTGATGKQGSAVVDGIIKSEQAQDFTILAVTRDPNSNSAKKLADRSPLIKIVKGDFADIPALFKTASEAAGQKRLWGVYSVQVFSGKGQNCETEEAYGKAMVDASLAAGVQHFVYSSVERGGNERSWTTPTNVPHFLSKHNIELHLREKAGDKMGWTILRPTAFMENFAPGFGFRMFMTMLKNNLGDKPLQLVSVRDIGNAAAKSFLNPAKFDKRAIGLAGDELSVSQIFDTIKDQTGKRQGPTFSLLATAAKSVMGEFSLMIDFFADSGFGVKIDELKRELPMTSFKEWLASGDSTFT